jgi:NADPH-ferrihemoprotein reductase
MCCQAVATKIVELRRDVSSGSTLHVELDLTGSGLSYRTADNLAIYADNSPADVEAMCKCQGYNKDCVFDVVALDGKTDSFKRPFPTPCSVGDALRYYLDIKVL